MGGPLNEVIGASHEFHDEVFARGWSERFVPTPERLALFDRILQELQSAVPPGGLVVELGIGPGYLARHLLEAAPEISYCGVDFSAPMLELAQGRLADWADRLVLLRSDLIRDPWWDSVHRPVDAIVSTWALHDLGGRDRTARVYGACCRLLRRDGVLLNGDFIEPEGARHEFEAGRFPIGIHIGMLRRAGFRTAECLLVLEREIEAPTAAQNYACLKAVR